MQCALFIETTESAGCMLHGVPLSAQHQQKKKNRGRSGEERPLACYPPFDKFTVRAQMPLPRACIKGRWLSVTCCCRFLLPAAGG